jgi:membrane protein
MNSKTLWGMLRETFNEWMEVNAPRLGASLAYYTAFSLAPLLLIAVAVAGRVYGEQAARGEIYAEVKDLLGANGADVVQEMLKQSNDSQGVTLGTLFGAVLLLIGASAVFVELQDALNTIWRVKVKPGASLAAMFRSRFLSFALVVSTGFILLVSLLVSATLAALTKFWTPASVDGLAYLWQGSNALVSFGFITLLFALLFKVMPDVRVDWRDVWVGAAVSALLFTGGKYAIGLYLGQSSVTSPFGAAGSLAVLLIWVYYSTQLVLFGAVFTRVYALHRGVRVVPTTHAMLVEACPPAAEGARVPAAAAG